MGGRLEAQLSSCVEAALLREGPNLKAKPSVNLSVQRMNRNERNSQNKSRDEEGKVKELLGWVRDWKRAQTTREFVSGLEKIWEQADTTCRLNHRKVSESSG